MIFNGFTELVSLGFRVATRRQLGGISREFSSIPVTRKRHPDNEQKNRDAQFAPKNGQKPSGAVTRAITQEGRNHPRGGGIFYRVLRGVGGKRSGALFPSFPRLVARVTKRHGPSALGK